MHFHFCSDYISVHTDDLLFADSSFQHLMALTLRTAAPYFFILKFGTYGFGFSATKVPFVSVCKLSIDDVRRTMHFYGLNGRREQREEQNALGDAENDKPKRLAKRH